MIFPILPQAGLSPSQHQLFCSAYVKCKYLEDKVDILDVLEVGPFSKFKYLRKAEPLRTFSKFVFPVFLLLQQRFQARHQTPILSFQLNIYSALIAQRNRKPYQSSPRDQRSFIISP